MTRMPGIDYDRGKSHGNVVRLDAIVLHRTYGKWAGDVAVCKRDGLCHFVIGKLNGQAKQLVDFEELQWHCGSNSYSFGIEFEGTNEEPLTENQLNWGAKILEFANKTFGIPLSYVDPYAHAPKSFNLQGGYKGVLSHYSVRPANGGSQHVDIVTVSDWNKMMDRINGKKIVPTPPPLVKEPVLSRGSNGPAVVEWQRFLGIPADGIFGPQTESETKKFQAWVNIMADGIVGPQTWAVKRFFESLPKTDPIPPTIRRGDRNDTVKYYQSLLHRANNKILVDGIFGEQTEAATKWIQALSHIAADGIVGPQTWKKIFESIGK